MSASSVRRTGVNRLLYTLLVILSTLLGYFLISLVSLYLYYAALNTLRRSGLVGDVSVSELLFELSRVFMVRYSDGSSALSETPKKVERLVQKPGIDILPKK